MATSTGHDIVVIGASAGGVEALARLVGQFPADLPAAVFVVLHVPPQGQSALPQILTRSGSLVATHAGDGDPLVPGRIYVAPPNHHLLLEDGAVSVVHGPRENRQRPAIDPLFRSAARSHGRRVVGVVLSGALDDGTSGLVAVKARGGVALVQDPTEALFASMPRSAIETVPVDRVLPAAELGAEITRLAWTPPAGEELPVTRDLDFETRLAEADPTVINADVHLGEPASLSCPECGGTLWELRDGRLTRFRCRVGHAFTANSWLDQQADVLEEALWSAYRNLEEQASLYRRLAERSEQLGHTRSADRHRENEQIAGQRAGTIRRVLANDALLSASHTESANA